MPAASHKLACILTASKFSEQFIAEFWSLVQQGNGCWEWQGRKTVKGYGCMWLKRKRVLAHRMSFELAKGPLVEFMCACHHCDNPSCVNPDHIFAGTKRENNMDRTRKGRTRSASFEVMSAAMKKYAARGENHGLRKHPERAARGDQNGAHTHPEKIPRGSKCLHAKLDEAQVTEIRSMYPESGMSYKKIGNLFGVTAGLIHLIVQRRIWTHIP